MPRSRKEVVRDALQVHGVESTALSEAHQSPQGDAGQVEMRRADLAVMSGIALGVENGADALTADRRVAIGAEDLCEVPAGPAGATAQDAGDSVLHVRRDREPTWGRLTDEMIRLFRMPCFTSR